MSLTFTKRQKPCLDSAKRNKDQVVFAEQIKNGYKYASFSTQEQYAEYILAGNTNCNEHLRESETHTYLDIDCKSSLEQLGFTKDEFIQEFSKFVIEKQMISGYRMQTPAFILCLVDSITKNIKKKISKS